MEQRGQQERLHLKSLRSKVEGERDMSFLQAFLTPIQRWADKQLGDYHLHFSEVCYFSDCCRDCAVLLRSILIVNFIENLVPINMSCTKFNATLTIILSRIPVIIYCR